jgi:hypothetical protein
MIDHFDRWMRIAGTRSASGWEPTLALYRDYSRFCEATGERCDGGVQQFSKKLRRYLVARRTKRARGWAGFRLKSGGGG